MKNFFLALVFVLLSAVSAQAATVGLTWTDNSNNEKGFNIYRAPDGNSTFSKVGSVGIDAATFTDLNVAPGSCYRVTAFNDVGESDPSNVDCLDTLPNSPSGTKVTVTVTVTVNQ
jgi:hypothetical protein